MFQTLKSFFVKRDTPEEPESIGPDARLRIAACAMLLELAHAEDEFSEEERAQIEESLMRHFDVDLGTARELIQLAERERREATDLFRFTSLITRHYDEGQRMVLAELLWRVVYADGKLSKHEDYLARKIAFLLELRPGYLAEARNRAARGRAQ